MKSGGIPYRLSPERLRWSIDPTKLPAVGEKTRLPLEIIGQDRALDALRMGLDIKQAGYHIFVTGTEGTGRTTMIRRILEERKTDSPSPSDLCYVFNFEAADHPLLLTFPAGKGRDFARRMDSMVGSLRRHIPELFRGEDYQKRVGRLERHYRGAQSDAVRDFAEEARQCGLSLVETQTGPYVRPELQVVIEDEAWEITELGILVEEGKLDQETATALEASHLKLSDELKELVRSNARLEETFLEELERVMKSVIHPLIHDSIEMLKTRFDNVDVDKWLDTVEEGLLEESWIRDEEEEELVEPFYRFGVNVVVDNSRLEGAPVIIESTPTFHNLFGTIDQRHLPNGAAFFDYRRIKTGALARAQGGTLVIMAQDLLEEGMVWPTLKRVLRNRELQIQAYDVGNRMVVGPLKPEPIKLDVKVILVGDTNLYLTLLQGDPDLQRVFKMKVDFATDMRRDRNNIRRYLSFMNKVRKQDELLPLTSDGSATILEYGARLAGRQDRLSTRFSKIVEILIESDYFARQAGSAEVSMLHVDKALDERVRRFGRTEENFLKMFREGTILLSTTGMAVGQVNGLFVMEQWDYAFGQPMRITASSSLGDGDIISIERETELSGSSFDKGHMILTGFIRQRFGQDKPLSLHTSVSCEQNYVGVDGDSASAAELFAILSSISRLPIKQGLAVTGSVNQYGEIQAVGGVNAKIEGFYHVCRDRGFKGENGVVIPAANVRDLMLNKDIVQSCRDGQFNVFAIKTIDQGLHLLTGCPAGQWRTAGGWTSGSVNDLVDRRLAEMAITMKQFGDRGDSLR
ncbi:MAG: AAA family ATPase [bacterium]|nr:AAA family ATPase [bacterium]